MDQFRKGHLNIYSGGGEGERGAVMMVIRASAHPSQDQITKYCHVPSPHTSRASFTPCPATDWDVKHHSDDVITDLPAINTDQAHDRPGTSHS